MALVRRSAQDTQWAALGSIAGKLGCAKETLASASGRPTRPDLTSVERERDAVSLASLRSGVIDSKLAVLVEIE